MKSEYVKNFEGITASEEAKQKAATMLIQYKSQPTANKPVKPANKPVKKEGRFKWNVKKTLIVASSVVAAVAILLCAVFIPLLSIDEGKDLTPEQKVAKIKRIYSGAYNAYFSKTQAAMGAGLSPITANLDDYLDEHGEVNISDESKKAYDRMYAWYTIILKTVTELKGTDVLSKKYTVSQDTDLIAKVSDKFADISSSDVDFNPVAYTALITSLEICELRNNTVYSRVTINTISCNFTVYYNNSSDFGFIIQSNAGFGNLVKYDNNNGDSKFIYIEETDDGYCYVESGAKGINLYDDIPDHVELIAEVAGILKSYMDNFNDSLKLFIEKEEVVLMFD